MRGLDVELKGDDDGDGEKRKDLEFRGWAVL